MERITLSFVNAVGSSDPFEIDFNYHDTIDHAITRIAGIMGVPESKVELYADNSRITDGWALLNGTDSVLERVYAMGLEPIKFYIKPDNNLDVSKLYLNPSIPVFVTSVLKLHDDGIQCQVYHHDRVQDVILRLLQSYSLPLDTPVMYRLWHPNSPITRLDETRLISDVYKDILDDEAYTDERVKRHIKIVIKCKELDFLFSDRHAPDYLGRITLMFLSQLRMGRGIDVDIKIGDNMRYVKHKISPHHFHVSPDNIIVLLNRRPVPDTFVFNSSNVHLPYLYYIGNFPINIYKDYISRADSNDIQVAMIDLQARPAVTKRINDRVIVALKRKLSKFNSRYIFSLLK